MVTLSKQQVDRIYDLLVNQGVNYEALQLDLLDHVCCMIEAKMDSGLDFGQSLTLSIQEFGLSNFREIQEATLYLLTLKLRKMKKVIGILGIISAVSVIAGVLFKINHFPGASILLVIGLSIVGLVVFPSLAGLEFRTKGFNLYSSINVLGYLTGVILTFATMLKLMHWPGSPLLFYTGMGLLSFVFIPLFGFKSYKTAENKILAVAKSLLILAGITIFLGLLPMGTKYSKFHQPSADQQPLNEKME